MPDESPRYRYFERPYQFSTYSVEPKPCDLCGQERPGFDGPFYGEGDVERVCEECLAAGRLAEVDGSTNEGDIAALKRQLRELHPDMRAEELLRLARERTAELELRTPHAVTWQDFFWPAHCGDYCRYVKEVGQPEIARLAPDGDGVAFFAAHAVDKPSLDQARTIWENVRLDTPQDGTLAYGLGVYLFRCTVCDGPIFLWDAD